MKLKKSISFLTSMALVLSASFMFNSHAVDDDETILIMIGENRGHFLKVKRNFSDFSTVPGSTPSRSVSDFGIPVELINVRPRNIPPPALIYEPYIASKIEIDIAGKRCVGISQAISYLREIKSAAQAKGLTFDLVPNIDHDNITPQDIRNELEFFTYLSGYVSSGVHVLDEDSIRAFYTNKEVIKFYEYDELYTSDED